MGGQQEYHRVPAVRETFLCEKGVCTGSEGACVCAMVYRERSWSEGGVVMGGGGGGGGLE